MSVLLILEPVNGIIHKASLGLLSYGRALARKLGEPLHVICLGELSEQEAQKAAKYGAARLLLGKNIQMEPFQAGPTARWIARLAREEQAGLIVFASGLFGGALAAATAAQLDAALATGVYALPESIEPFRIKKTVFSGKAIATLQLNRPVKVLSLQANAFEPREDPDSSFEQLILEDALPGQETSGMELLSKESQAEAARLTEAEVVVSGGRGMRGPQNWAPLEELARLLNAATACSRPVSDEGWRPHTEHVGQTGKIIAPHLYIALGISGAIQHLAGVQASKVILAVNKDPEASIFQAADYGIVGDLQEVLPAMIDAVKKLKQ